jgi:hypothetical protein
MKIAGVTVCFNESKLVKYVMPYWERIGIDKLIVYDNMSTDNTVELLKQYPFVEIRSFDTGGKFNDNEHSKIKNRTVEELKSQGYDWIYSGDFDEVIYCDNPNFREELQKIDDLGGTVFCRDMVHPFSPSTFEFDSSKLIHEQLPWFLTWRDLTRKWSGSKVLLHKSKSINKLLYKNGQHEISLSTDSDILYFGYPFIAFHLKYVDLNVLYETSATKNERMQWRIEKSVNKKIKNHLTKLYGRTSNDESINETKNKIIKNIEKYDTTSWNKLLDRYNSYEFLVNRTKTNQFDRKAPIPRLDYDTVDMNIFYRKELS